MFEVLGPQDLHNGLCKVDKRDQTLVSPKVVKLIPKRWIDETRVSLIAFPDRYIFIALSHSWIENFSSWVCIIFQSKNVFGLHLAYS